jgi:hypothetical protein
MSYFLKVQHVIIGIQLIFVIKKIKRKSILLDHINQLNPGSDKKSLTP